MRSVGSRSIAVLPIGSRSRLRRHSATAKEYCPHLHRPSRATHQSTPEHAAAASAPPMVRQRSPAGRLFASFDASCKSGYNLARMPFEIVLAPEAVEDLRGLTASVRATVRTALETHLRHEPGKTSRSRIKRLRGLTRPQYRLRIGEVRVFYDISGSTVQVLAIVAKSEAE